MSDAPTSLPSGSADDHTTDFAESNYSKLLGGKYKLLNIIGEGGMGAVWLAEQRDPVRRLVAVKLIKSGMDSKSVLARFDAERQALALMDHPNIAKILDGGISEMGAPYFVMELVKGVPITEFCDAKKLNITERLALFIPVCQAIQHAHQKGIIHRDIKPSNVLVTLYDDRMVPKIIDFGVAKATGQSLTEGTLCRARQATGNVLLFQGRQDEAESLLKQAIDESRDFYRRFPGIPNAQNILAMSLSDYAKSVVESKRELSSDQLTAIEAYATEAVRLQRELDNCFRDYGYLAPLIMQSNLARIKMRLNKVEEAKELVDSNLVFLDEAIPKFSIFDGYQLIGEQYFLKAEAEEKAEQLDLATASYCMGLAKFRETPVDELNTDSRLHFAKGYRKLFDQAIAFFDKHGRRAERISEEKSLQEFLSKIEGTKN